MSKVLFVFQPHSMVDIITNSSSELFVFKGKSKKMVEEMIKSVYPDYLEEYNELVHIDDLSVEELDNFITYHCSPHQWPASRSNYPLIGDYTFDELYEPEIRNGVVLVAWNDEVQYTLKDNTRPPKKEKVKKFDDFHKDLDPYGEEDWDGDDNFDDFYHNRYFVTNKNIEEVKNRIDPNHRMYFLYSRGDNPNWDYQEGLEKIGNRYHLG